MTYRRDATGGVRGDVCPRKQKLIFKLNFPGPYTFCQHIHFICFIIISISFNVKRNFTSILHTTLRPCDFFFINLVRFSPFFSYQKEGGMDWRCPNFSQPLLWFSKIFYYPPWTFNLRFISIRNIKFVKTDSTVHCKINRMPDIWTPEPFWHMVFNFVICFSFKAWYSIVTVWEHLKVFQNQVLINEHYLNTWCLFDASCTSFEHLFLNWMHVYCVLMCSNFVC